MFGTTNWWLVTDDDATELDAGGIDPVALAAMFGSIGALCEAIALSPYGTHYQGYTVNDQAAACFAISEAGGTSVQAMAAVLATPGRRGGHSQSRVAERD